MASADHLPAAVPVVRVLLKRTERARRRQLLSLLAARGGEPRHLVLEYRGQADWAWHALNAVSGGVMPVPLLTPELDLAVEEAVFQECARLLGPDVDWDWERC